MDHLLTTVVNDPSLSDVPTSVERHALELLVAKARRLSDVLMLQLTLCDGSALDLEALPQWTVAQLKRLVERVVSSRLETTAGRSSSISWKSHWKRWALVYDGAELDDGRRPLESYGMVSTATLHFKPRRQMKPTTTKAPRQKRRTHTSNAQRKEKPLV